MAHERDLLFGVLAVQAELLDEAQFTEARTTMDARPGTPLAELLVERGWITLPDREHLTYLLERKLARYDGDARACLAAAAPQLLPLAESLSPGCQDSQGAWGDLTPPPPLAMPEGKRNAVSGHAATLTPSTIPGSKTAVPTESGRYSRLHVHGVGGIGRVWLTRDGILGRQVALKELRPETAQHPVMRSRFLEEARITGQLEHPGIIPVYELVPQGDSGPPFYTMRFVRGNTLTRELRDYHQRRKQGQATPLDLRTLLNAFVAVCNTVAYAHSRGVVHRDLKGQNVVLGDFGEVIVLDWGLAKVMNRPESAADVPAVNLEQGAEREATLQGQALGTPAYMAPEQAAGRLDQIDARTDVYGLGAILYELLTDQPPFTGTDTNDVLYKVQFSEPKRPSQLVAGVPPALQAICLKALAREPDARYPSAAELARDMQRWLADEPVSVYREPLMVRLGRLARRHKTLVAGSGAILITAVIALAISTALIGQQKARAEDNYRMAREAVERFYVRVSEEKLLNEPGFQPLRKSLLETARDFFQRFADANADDPARQADLGKTLLKLARITAEIDTQARSVELLERARVILEDLVRRHPGDPEHRHELATYHNLLATRHREAGRNREAEASYLRGVELARQVVEEHGRNPTYRQTLGLCLNNLGLLYRDLREPDKAAAASAEARQIQEKLVEDHPAEPRYWSDLAGSYNNVASFQSSRDKPAEAAELLYRAQNLWSRLLRSQPPSPELQENLAMSHYNLAVLFATHSHSEHAWGPAQNAIQLYTRLVRANPTVTRYRIRLARAQTNLGDIFVQFWESAPAGAKPGFLAAARTAYEEALAITEALVREHPGIALFTLHRAMVCTLLGNWFYYADQLPTALEWFRLAITYVEACGKETADSPDGRRPLMLAFWGRAVAFADLGRNEDAVPEWDRAIPLAEGRFQVDFRLSRALCLARIGEHVRAATEANALAREHPKRLDALLDLLRVLALSVTAAERDDRVPAEKRPLLVADYVATAVVLLKRAAAAGSLKNPAFRKAVLEHKDFAPLRTREEFKELSRETTSNGKRGD